MADVADQVDLSMTVRVLGDLVREHDQSGGCPDSSPAWAVARAVVNLWDAAGHEPSEVEHAIGLLWQHGRKCLSGSSQEPMKGECVGLAVAHGMGPLEVEQAAEAMLTDWNAHLNAAALRALRGHHFELDGRTLTITLPAHWVGH